MTAARRARRLRGALVTVAPFLLLLGVWQLAVSAGLIDRLQFSSPDEVFPALVDQLRAGRLGEALGATALEFVIAFPLAAVVGVLLGTAMGWYRTVEYALDPWVWFLYAAPFVALFPVFILVLGLGTPTVIMIAFLLALNPILVSMMRGVKDADPKITQAARSFGASDRQVFLHVVLPGAMPLLMAGLRIAAGRTLTGVVVGELFAGEHGLGHDIGYFGAQLQTSVMVADILVVAVLGISVTAALRAAEHRLDRWRTDAARGSLG